MRVSFRRSSLVVAIVGFLLLGMTNLDALASSTASISHPPKTKVTKKVSKRINRVTRVGSRLLLDGKPWRFTGVNAYGAATDWNVNWGCGSQIDDLDRLFTGLRPGSVVRFWAFQAQAWNNKAAKPRLDWGPIDRVVHAAEARKQLLILTLSDQAGTCDDGHWHDSAWYEGGFRKHYNDNGRGLGSMSYLQWVRAIVSRYKNSPAVAFWEPVNEAEASDCTGVTGYACWDGSHLTCDQRTAPWSLRGFFDTIGRQIRAIDRRHLIAVGLRGAGECGVNGGYPDIAASKYVDLLTFHDYGAESDAFPGGLRRRLVEARSLHKPLAVEESGISGGAGCRNLTVRANAFGTKLRSAFGRGAVGYLPWWYEPSPADCGDQLAPGDPTFKVLSRAPR